MKKDEANKILMDISEECDTHMKCSECAFYKFINDVQAEGCVFLLIDASDLKDYAK